MLAPVWVYPLSNQDLQNAWFFHAYYKLFFPALKLDVVGGSKSKYIIKNLSIESKSN